MECRWLDDSIMDVSVATYGHATVDGIDLKCTQKMGMGCGEERESTMDGKRNGLMGIEIQHELVIVNMLMGMEMRRRMDWFKWDEE